jgi:hypothetical protein
MKNYNEISLASNAVLFITIRHAVPLNAITIEASAKDEETRKPHV